MQTWWLRDLAAGKGGFDVHQFRGSWFPIKISLVWALVVAARPRVHLRSLRVLSKIEVEDKAFRSKTALPTAGAWRGVDAQQTRDE